MLRSITRRPNFLLSPSTRIQQRSFTIPYVIEREGAAERTYDIFARLLKDRIVCIMGGIDDRVSAAVVAQLLFLSLDQPDAPIKMYINSPGGVVTSGMAIYDTMQMVPSPIETWCMGQACSMGSLLLTAGTPGKINKQIFIYETTYQGQRYALPNSRVMIHQPSGGAQGQATDILIQVTQLDFIFHLTIKIHRPLK